MPFHDNTRAEICHLIRNSNSGILPSNSRFICIYVRHGFVNVSYCREPGQGNVEDLRNRDFRKDLEDREKDGTGTKAVAPVARSAIKRPKLDQVPAASLDADDPIEGDSSDSDDSDDDTAALLAELDRIKKERAIEQAKKVIFNI